MLLQIPYKGTTVDLAANSLLYHVSPVEFQARVYCLYAHCCKVGYFLMQSYWYGSYLDDIFGLRNYSSVKNHWKTSGIVCKQGGLKSLVFEVHFLNHPIIQQSSLVCSSYAEVRAERRRELGIEESLPEISADKVSVLYNFFFASSHTKYNVQANIQQQKVFCPICPQIK